MKKVLLLAPLLVTSPGFGLAQSTITIGDTQIESVLDSENANVVVTQQADLSQAATINSISFYVSVAQGHLRLGIYDASGPAGKPGQLLAQSTSFKPSNGWNTQNVTSPVVLQPGTYWLAYLPSSRGLRFVKRADSGNCWYHTRSFSNGLPSIFPATGDINCTPTTWSFYATLTPRDDAKGDGIARARKDDRDRPRLPLDGSGRRGRVCQDDDCGHR